MKLLTAAQYREQLATAMSEADLQQQVLQLAEVLGWRAYHTHDSRRSQPGFPDLVLVHAGRRRLLFAELKRAKGRATREQLAWLHDLSETGAETYIWRPADLLAGTIHDALTRPPPPPTAHDRPDDEEHHRTWLGSGSATTPQRTRR